MCRIISKYLSLRLDFVRKHCWSTTKLEIISNCDYLLLFNNKSRNSITEEMKLLRLIRLELGHHNLPVQCPLHYDKHLSCENAEYIEISSQINILYITRVLLFPWTMFRRTTFLTALY